MLVLGRKIGEEILIGDKVRVVVVGIRGSQVRLGFDAPPEVSIRRDEMHQREMSRVAGSTPTVDASTLPLT
jgi:carbon storage regulator